MLLEDEVVRTVIIRVVESNKDGVYSTLLYHHFGVKFLVKYSVVFKLSTVPVF